MPSYEVTHCDLCEEPLVYNLVEPRTIQMWCNNPTCPQYQKAVRGQITWETQFLELLTQAERESIVTTPWPDSPEVRRQQTEEPDNIRRVIENLRKLGCKPEE